MKSDLSEGLKAKPAKQNTGQWRGEEGRGVEGRTCGHVPSLTASVHFSK